MLHVNVIKCQSSKDLNSPTRLAVTGSHPRHCWLETRMWFDKNHISSMPPCPGAAETAEIESWPKLCLRVSDDKPPQTTEDDVPVDETTPPFFCLLRSERNESKAPKGSSSILALCCSSHIFKSVLMLINFNGSIIHDRPS